MFCLIGLCVTHAKALYKYILLLYNKWINAWNTSLLFVCDFVCSVYFMLIIFLVINVLNYNWISLLTLLTNYLARTIQVNTSKVCGQMKACKWMMQLIDLSIHCFMFNYSHSLNWSCINILSRMTSHQDINCVISDSFGFQSESFH